MSDNTNLLMFEILNIVSKFFQKKKKNALTVFFQRVKQFTLLCNMVKFPFYHLESLVFINYIHNLFSIYQI